MILRPLNAVWDLPFDVAYTVRPRLLPLNAGVVFVRVSDRVRAFMTAWRDENRRMLTDTQHHQVWRRRYGGINQAALGAVLESPRTDGLAITPLPCSEWNCEDSTWRAYDPDVTRIVHLKSQLRIALFHGGSGGQEVRRLVTLWRALERAAL